MYLCTIKLITNLKRKTMTVYKLKFTYFDGVEWTLLTKEIVALNLFQLMKCFLKETEFQNETIWKEGQRLSKTQKDLWCQVKKYISKEELTFPLVTFK